ncbi:MAG: helix-turn-helix protein [Bradyrhizobium sp.]|nr:helix-turn-helix protein [Bradyrhizobium sp.]
MSERTNRVFTTEFKERAVLRLEAGEQFSALAVELGVRRKLLYDWHKSYRQLGVAGLNRKRGPKPGGRRLPAPPERGATDPLAQAQTRVAELERLVGRQQVDLDFFRRALRLTDAGSPSGSAPTSTRSSKP